MKIMLILLTCFAASGCSWQKYDKNNPDAYHIYWCDPKNKNRNVLSGLVKEAPDILGFPKIDSELAKQRCIDHYLQRKYKEKKQRVIEKEQESN